MNAASPSLTRSERHSTPTVSDVLEDYLATCKEACDGEIARLYGPGERGSNGLYDLILDYPLRGGKALRPALSIAICLGLGGHLEAVLPTAATLELYHNAFLIHDDIEDGSWTRRGKPTLHIDHGIPIAVNVGDAMLSLSLQPLLDNVERVRARAGLAHPAGRLPHDPPDRRRARRSSSTGSATIPGNSTTRTTSHGRAEDELVLIHHASAGRRNRSRRRTRAAAPLWRPSGDTSAPPSRSPTTCSTCARIPRTTARRSAGDLWEGKRTLMLLHAMRNADARAIESGRADPGQTPTERRRRAQTGPTCWIGCSTAESCRGPDGTRSRLTSRDNCVGAEDPRRHSLALWADAAPRVVRARKAGGRSTHPDTRPPSWPTSTGYRPAGTGTCSPLSSNTYTGAHDDPRRPAGHARRAGTDPRSSPSTSSSGTPHGCSRPAGRGARRRADGTRPTSGRRRAVLGNPAAARGLHDMLVAEGRRYSETPDGAQLRDALVASEAVENLRRVWETVSLNVLDGPAAPNAAPTAWAELAGRCRDRARPRRLGAGPPATRGVRMTLTDPREALADQSNFIGCLVGAGRSGRVVRGACAEGEAASTPR